MDPQHLKRSGQTHDNPKVEDSINSIQKVSALAYKFVKSRIQLTHLCIFQMAEFLDASSSFKYTARNVGLLFEMSIGRKNGGRLSF